MHQVTENDGYHVHLSDAKCRSAAWQAWSSETKPWHPEINKGDLLKARKWLLFHTKQTRLLLTWKSLIGSCARVKTGDVVPNAAIELCDVAPRAFLTSVQARKYTDANLEKKIFKKRNRETQKEPVRNCTNEPDVKVSLLVEARIGRSYKTDISSVFGAKTKRLT